jgi:excisionase family DNA binding protein
MMFSRLQRGLVYGAIMNNPTIAELVATLANELRRVQPVTLPRVAYTLDEIAAMCGVSKRVVEGQIEIGALKTKRIGRTLCVTARELERWLNHG